jgi:hypothetical protein
MRGRRLGALVAVAVAMAAAAPARAQEFPVIADRDYALDLHQGAVLGSGRIVGMGGAAVATAEGSSGLLFNPAAAAVRSETSTGNWDWDWHIDWLTPQLGSDHDNNGMAQETEVGLSGSVITFGLVGQVQQWGFGVTAIGFDQPGEEAADGTRVVPSVLMVRVSAARSWLEEQITVGLGYRVGAFGMNRRTQDAPDLELFSITGTGLDAGAIWRPRDLDLRAGLSASLPVSSESVTTGDCDPLDCDGFILPGRVAAPWQLGAGLAYRFAETSWHRPVTTRWRDERSVLVAADLVVTGRVPDGHGIEAFSRMQLQPSGRSIGLSPRAGAEYEWVPGRFRLRGGSYWEPSRFRAPDGRDIPGRLHLTLGLDLRIWQFRLWGKDHRVRLSMTADGATGYGNGGLSIGFWH